MAAASEWVGKMGGALATCSPRLQTVLGRLRLARPVSSKEEHPRDFPWVEKAEERRGAIFATTVASKAPT